MSPAGTHAPLVSPDEYLAAEITSEWKHEYVDGMVYERPGGTVRHCDLTGNIVGALHGQLRGRPCRLFGSDMLLRVQCGDDLRFYYPDVSIICRSAGPEERVQSEPAIIFEVLSESTARTDTGEKRMAYLTIPTLKAYAIVDSERREVTVWRKGSGKWAPEVLTEPSAELEFASAGCAISIAEIYEGTGL